jgi:hypothetical protein
MRAAAAVTVRAVLQLPSTCADALGRCSYLALRAAAAIIRRAARQLSFVAVRQLQFWRAALQLQLCLLVRARAAPQVHLLGMLRYSCS